jgi:uncharacterized protein YjbI with pentapeptide repeats
MGKEKDLSNYAAFDVDDIVAEIKSKKHIQKEATAYLDRNFLVNMINEHHRQAKVNKLDFTVTKQIDLSDYNFSGADFRGISREDFELFNFNNCDITAIRLDRVGIDFFHEYIINNNIIFEGLNFEGAYLGSTFVSRNDLGIQCHLFLNLSNINLTGSNFSNSNIDGLMLENTNISYCNFANAKNLDPKQFAFTMGFENATFSLDKAIDLEIKNKIKQHSNELDPEVYYANTYQKSNNKFIAYLANLTNILDD